MTKIKETELIKMENGKTELPSGVSRTKHGYRIHKRVAGTKYNFGSFQNLNLAIKTNEYIDRLTNDYRAELKRKVNIEEKLIVLLAENSAVDMHQINRNFYDLTELIDSQNEQIQKLEYIVTTLSSEVIANNKKSLVDKLLKR